MGPRWATAGYVCLCLWSAMAHAGPAEQAAAALQEGIAAQQAGNLQQAAEKWSAAAPLFSQAGDHSKAALCWWNSGVAYDRLERYDDAATCFTGALDEYTKLQSPADQAACLSRIAMDLWYLRQYDQALARYREALALYTDLSQDKDRADCLRHMAGVHQDARRHEQALECLQTALDLYERLAMAREQADCRAMLGLSLWRLDRHEQAAAQYEQALQQYTALGLQEQIADCQSNLGLVRTSQGRYEQAIELFGSAAERYVALDLPRGQADCRRNEGVACRNLGLYDRAISRYEEALAVYERLGLAEEQADCWNNIGVAFCALGQYQAAVEQHERSLAVYVASGSAEEAAACHQNLGVAYKELGQVDTAIECFTRAETIYQDLHLPREQADCRTNIGAAHGRAGRHGAAVTHYLQALSTYRELGLQREAARCLVNLATSYLDLRDHTQAAEYCEQALTVYEALGLKREQADCWVNLGVARRGLQQYEASLQALDKACLLYRELAASAAGAGRLWTPEPIYRAQAAIAETLRARAAEGDLCAAYRHLARAVTIVEHLRARAASSTQLRTGYFEAMSWVYDETVDLLAEMRYADLPLAPEAMQETEPEFWQAIGLPTPSLWPGWQSYEEAVLHYCDASRARVLQELLSSRRVALADAHTSKLHQEWTALVAQERDVQERLVATEEGDEAAAWRQRAEEVRRRAEEVERELSKTRWGQVVQAKPLGLTKVRELLEPDEALIEYKVLWDRLVAVIVTRGRIELWLQAVTSGAQRPIWGAAEGLRGEEVLQRLAGLQAEAATAAGLPPGAAGTAEPDQLARSFTIPELVWLFRRPMGLLSSSDADARQEAEMEQGQQLRLASALYGMLLEPFAEMMDTEGIRSLLLVPDGALYYLPFSALVSHLPAGVDDAPGGNLCAQEGLQFALDRWRIAVLPSAAMYAGVREAAAASSDEPARRLCVLADPVFKGDPRGVTGRDTAPGGELNRLPNTREEAKQALAAFGSGPEAVTEAPDAVLTGDNIGLLGPAAREACTRDPKLHDYGYLLLSTHGIIMPEHPEFSYIALSSPDALGVAAPQASEDGRLMLPEAFGLNLNARMVTLSACRTAEGDFRRGEGILGLVAAMFVSGAQAVTASMWSVDDRQTARLMGGYHAGLGAGQAPAEALRAAQLAVLQEARAAFEGDPTAPEVTAAHPYYWAPFVLVGR